MRVFIASGEASSVAASVSGTVIFFKSSSNELGLVLLLREESRIRKLREAE